MKKIIFTVSCLALVSACSEVPKGAFGNRGDLERMMDQSSEVINVSLAGGNAVDEVTQWVNQDQPTRAEVLCMEGERLCEDVRGVLDQFGVPVEFTSSTEGNVTLIYSRVLARDCDPSFVDNSINPYNFNHPAFGCATAANSLQMITDKQQITNPALVDYQDAAKAVQTYGKYTQPPEAKGKEKKVESVLDSNLDKDE